VTAAVADRGLWALLLGCPLIVLVDPALSRRGLAVLLASLVALLLAATVGRRGGLRAAARASG
jgi:hypothetical protein